MGQDCQSGRRAELVGIQCPVGCRQHKGMWCCEAPRHQGSPMPAPCHFSCSACWYQTSLSLNPPISWGNEWVWRFQGITAPRLSHGSSPRNSLSLQTTQGWGKALAGTPHQPPSSPTEKHGTSTGSKPVSASWELLPWKAWTRLCPKWLQLPQHSPGQAPAHQTWLWHSVTLKIARLFPIATFP